jgi:hypothetical protein
LHVDGFTIRVIREGSALKKQISALTIEAWVFLGEYPWNRYPVITAGSDEVKDKQGVTWAKVPNFIYPVDQNGKTALMQDLRHYSNNALSDALLKLDSYRLFPDRRRRSNLSKYLTDQLNHK